MEWGKIGVMSARQAGTVEKGVDIPIHKRGGVILKIKKARSASPGSKEIFRPLFVLGLISLFIVGPVFITAVQAQIETNRAEGRETVLDRKVHIEKEWVLDIPEVSRLCDVLPLKKHRINVGDCELYCDEEGEGTPIVLISGGPGTTHHHFHPWFSKAANFARVIYYDQRGCGLSDYKPGAGYSVSQAVDDLEKLRQGLNIDDWVVIGHSYGGYLAQKYAVKYPDQLAGLVLIGATDAVGIQVGTRQWDYMTAEERKKIAEAQQAKDLTPEQQMFNAHLFGDWKRQSFYRPSREELARMVKYEWKHDPTFRGQISRTMERDLSGFFDAFPVPTLIMEGKWDLTWTADKPQKMQDVLPRAQLIVFERSSHNPFEDEPDRFFAELENYVRQHQKPSASQMASWRKDLEIMSQSAAGQIRRLMSSSKTGAGAEASKKIVEAYKKEWLSQLNAQENSSEVLRLGWALYDEKRYEDALEVFKKSDYLLVWQGHMQDLLGRREEAIQCYQEAIDTKKFMRARHDQYGIIVSLEYLKECLEKPFTRIENNWK